MREKFTYDLLNISEEYETIYGGVFVVSILGDENRETPKCDRKNEA